MTAPFSLRRNARLAATRFAWIVFRGGFAKRLAPRIGSPTRTQPRKLVAELRPEQDSNLRPTA